MLLVYTLTVFIGAALVFLVQPLIAKQLLPRLGGSPAVWNACMVFFQAALLAGYGYAHGIRRIRNPRAATAIHLAFLLVPLAFLPLVLPSGWTPGDTWPPLWVLGVLAMSVGLPFVAVATTSPLLQTWFSRTDHPHAHDPYFLYAASNAGSLLGLLSYPFLLEPLLAVSSQAHVWSVIYGVFLVSVSACALLLWKRGQAPSLDAPQAAAPAEAEAAPAAALTPRARARWVLLALVPSSLTLSVTHHLSTDLAAIPLLWVVPLALYLVTFIVAFAARGQRLVKVAWLAVPLALLVVTLALLVEAAEPLALIVGLHLLSFFICALACHGWLAAERPPPERLTEFFLWIALGGVLGGSFNGLLGPLVFPGLWEYPIALVLVALLRSDPLADLDPDDDTPPEGIKVPAAAFWLAPIALCLIWVVVDRSVEAYDLGENPAARLVQSMVPLVGCYLLSRRRYPFALGLALLLCLPLFLPRGVHLFGERIHAERTFFGVHSVWEDDKHRVLIHGSTVHGIQYTSRTSRAAPLAYYSTEGPAGDVFQLLDRDPRGKRVGLIGLGVGTLAAYGRHGRHFTFFEIDPAVVRIAQDYFFFLGDCQATTNVVTGDGRLRLEENVEDGSLGLLVLDAFSSDAIPTHLITKEAMQLYLRKLQPRGLILFHISNRYVNLRPVLGNLARDLKLVVRGRYHGDLSEEYKEEGILASNWAVLARRPEDLGGLLALRMWKPVPPDDRVPTWTDDYSNVLSVMSWK
jgi:SAM-dependent methyltransferase